MKSLKPIVNFLKKNKIDFRGSSLSIRKALRVCGFKFLGRGCYKSVYKHKKFPKWVVKVSKLTGVEDDCLNYMSLPKSLRKYYVRPSFRKGRVTIQQKCDTKKQSRYEAQRMIQSRCRHLSIDIYDVHDYNTGFLKGKPVFFDFLHEPW